MLLKNLQGFPFAYRKYSTSSADHSSLGLAPSCLSRWIFLLISKEAVLHQAASSRCLGQATRLPPWAFAEPFTHLKCLPCLLFLSTKLSFKAAEIPPPPRSLQNTPALRGHSLLNILQLSLFRWPFFTCHVASVFGLPPSSPVTKSTSQCQEAMVLLLNQHSPNFNASLIHLGIL